MKTIRWMLLFAALAVSGDAAEPPPAADN